MNRFVPAGALALAALLLAACQSPAPATSSQRYGAASQVAVSRHAQYRLWEQGTFSVCTPETVTPPLMTANSESVSFDWEGDAVELLNALARARGLQFSYSGVRLPLPVTLHVRDMTFANALRLIEAQTAWRATLHQYPGLLNISFMQPERKK
ncbi:hypothetical protein EXO80_22240 [Salmonella enterica]|nr:hypothetical protein [Salmonella enterica]ECH1725621.1 hypothetical protein [Salmonella enterica]